MRLQLNSVNPWGLGLLLLGVVLALCAGKWPEKARMPVRIGALVLAFIGAILCFAL